MSVFLPIIYNIGAIVAGFACGFILSKLMTPTRSNDNRLILVIAMLLSVCGICALIDISPLLSCMVLSATYINLTHDKELYHQIDAFTPPVMSLFFIVSGMNLNLSSLATFGFVGVAYFIIRIIGKYVGAFFGSLTVRMPKNIRNYLGLALVPQAGVAIGLAFLGERMLGPTQGGIFLSIILASSVLYELVGPACAKYALFASGTIKKDKLPKPQ
ncbi:MAG: cation:proton antiporter, partial [Clostridia bacterium]